MREPASLAPTSTTPRRRRIPPPRRRPRILVVIGVLNGFDLLADSLGRLVAATDEADVLLIDNGSDLPLAREPWMPAGVRVVRNETNRGTYPLFGQVLTLADRAEILAFLHQDLWVHERGWDDRVRRAFADDDRLGLVGFVGSSQIDDRGGRGLGTMLNFSGIGLASPAEEHGRRVAELRPAVVVDGCAMVFRRRTLEEIGTRPDFPPHHFYDRLMSCQVVEAGWRVGVLGVACDHLGNQTAGTQPSWHELARQWAEGHGLPGAPGRWDEAVYLEAERRFLEEWRDEKRFVPLFIADDWTVWRPS